MCNGVNFILADDNIFLAVLNAAASLNTITALLASLLRILITFLMVTLFTCATCTSMITIYLINNCLYPFILILLNARSDTVKPTLDKLSLANFNDSLSLNFISISLRSFSFTDTTAITDVVHDFDFICIYIF